MSSTESQQDSAPDRTERLNIGVAMLLIAGATVGIWLALGELRSRNVGGGPDDYFAKVIFAFVFALGGFALVGVPLLLWTARRRPWGAGRLQWFAHGTAAWLLWPPIVYQRIEGRTAGSMSAICYFYGTPLMALYMTLALLAGGHLRRSKARRMLRSWQETFGILLGLAWACTGLYLISLFYRQDILGK
jgi:hypothetical protein